MEVDVSYTGNLHCMRNGVALSVRSPGVYSARSAGVSAGCAGGVIGSSQLLCLSISQYGLSDRATGREFADVRQEPFYKMVTNSLL
jgi:hypothetical protein